MPSRVAVVSLSGVTVQKTGRPAEMELVTAVTAAATPVTIGLKPAWMPAFKTPFVLVTARRRPEGAAWSGGV